MRHKQQDIHSKGFAMYDSPSTKYTLEEENTVDFSKMRVGVKTLSDAVIDINSYKKVNPNLGDKVKILEALKRRDIKKLREISDFFFDLSGIYNRLVEYLAFIYRYDWCVTAFQIDSKIKDDKILKDFANALNYLDNSNIKSLLGQISLEIMRHGVYYGIYIDQKDNFQIQQLPVDYCRTRFFQGTIPMVELNMKFFDIKFPDIKYRQKILKMFPEDVQRGYLLYQQKKLPVDFLGDDNGWYLLEPGTGVRFCLNNREIPPLVSAIPSIIDLDNAQELDRRKTMQQLLKILIQKLPLDKNGELIFDMEEAKDIHNNAVQMIKKRSVGIDILTTFADVESIDTYDKNSATSTDDLQKIERTVYNNAGISQNLFNTNGNLSLEKSILTDEASMKDLLYQFQGMLNNAVKKFGNPRHYNFKVQILETTIFNYKEISKMYKEHVSLGFSKFLPQIALGQSQSSILAALQFENQVLHLSDIMIPPMSSNTMSNKTNSNSTNSNNSQSSSASSNPEGGRQEKPDDQKSEKTIQNKESMS